MKFQAFVKQIRNGSDPMAAEWQESGDLVLSRDMAVVYAAHVAMENRVPVKVVCYQDCGEEAAEYPQLHDKVVAYFGPKEHAVSVDWIDYLSEGDHYRVSPDGVWTEKKRVIAGEQVWAVAVIRFDSKAYADGSAARYARAK